MKTSFPVIILALLFSNCNSPIKDGNVTVVEELVADTNALKPVSADAGSAVEKTRQVFWVGYFLNAENENDAYKNDVYAGEGFTWRRENKINISIDNINGDKVSGHSVVAGNSRPFAGTVKTVNGISTFEVKEPGNNKYDGAFSFTTIDSLLEGTWKSSKKIDIPNRKYRLTKRTFAYNPDIMLTKNARFIDWEKKLNVKQPDAEEEEFEDAYFSSATGLIFSMNASNKLLNRKEVENLKKGDLLISVCPQSREFEL